MSTYLIGDLQGCFDSLQALLSKIQFHPEKDQLGFVGDLINRGPKSLETLRFIRQLENPIIVLGNHDLHLIAVAYGVQDLKHDDTLREVLDAPDGNELIDWLRHRPLLHHDKTLNVVMTHAGIAPSWNLQKARALAHEVESVLQSHAPELFLRKMYGDKPDVWRDDLVGADRLRCITNYLTRMRFCYADGRLDLAYKGEISGKPQELEPWFMLPNRMNAHLKLIFGHWAALGGHAEAPNIYPLDTGCVWGNSLTALRLEDEKRFSVKCG